MADPARNNTIGFIGLGMMGAGMAANLLKACRLRYRSEEECAIRRFRR